MRELLQYLNINTIKLLLIKKNIYKQGASFHKGVKKTKIHIWYEPKTFMLLSHTFSEHVL